MTANAPYLLLVDDDPEDRELFIAAFTKENPTIPVKSASNGIEVMTFLEKHSDIALPKVLLIDYQMPILDGPGLLQALETDSRYKHIIKIMWSTSQRTKDMEDCRRHGASHYLVKPATNFELQKIIHQLTAVFDFASREKQ